MSKDRSTTFHSIVQKLMFIDKRFCPDLQSTIYFLCTRVQLPNVIDWKNLKRAFQFVNRTVDEKLALLADNDLRFMIPWIDASYAVYLDMKSYTRGCITLGRDIIHCRFSKQTLNTKSLIEDELVGQAITCRSLYGLSTS